MITEIILDKWLIPQLQEILMAKMNKGDIQAEFDLQNSIENKKIRINLKQLFIIIQALAKLDGVISLEEVVFKEGMKEDNPFTRDLFLKKDGKVIKDLTNMGATIQDLMIRDSARVVESQWNKE